MPSSPAAVVPAAGSSRRMGRPKPLLPWAESTLIGAVLDALALGGVERRVVVAREDDASLRAWLDGHAGVTIALNGRPELGMLHSIRLGCEALDAPADPLLVCPADLPALRPATVAGLLAAHRAGRGDEILVPSWHGRRGHPLLVPLALQAEIDALDPLVGLRQILSRHADRVVLVPVDDPGSVRDADSPEQLRDLAADREPG